MKRKLQWRPDLPDHRDHIYRSSSPLPVRVDLRQYCSRVEDQGEIGSCTGNAIVGALELLENRRRENFVDLSRLFVYYNERLAEGTVGEDAGALIRDGIKSIASQGVCTEALWPYDPSRFTRKPSMAAYEDGLRRVVKRYRRIVGLSDMLGCLAEGYPFVFGFTVYSSFMEEDVAATGRMQMPQPFDGCEGGHAVLAVGYDQEQRHVIVRNSWGEGWGDGGYFYMPFDYIGNPHLADDMWMVES